MFFILWIAVGLMTVIATGEDVANYGKPNTGAPVLQQQHNTNSIKGQSAQPGQDFQNIFSAYFDQMRKFQEQFANNIQMAQQQAMAGIPNFSGGLPQNNFGQGAFASASVGPDGSYHSAGVFPENPNNPNVINRHNPASTQPGQGNFYGVASSSFSSASDVNGQKTETREAQTTTNDNRKITTYRVKYP